MIIQVERETVMTSMFLALSLFNKTCLKLSLILAWRDLPYPNFYLLPWGRLNRLGFVYVSIPSYGWNKIGCYGVHSCTPLPCGATWFPCANQFMTSYFDDCSFWSSFLPLAHLLDCFLVHFLDIIWTLYVIALISFFSSLKIFSLWSPQWRVLGYVFWV